MRTKVIKRRMRIETWILPVLSARRVGEGYVDCKEPRAELFIAQTFPLVAHSIYCVCVCVYSTSRFERHCNVRKCVKKTTTTTSGGPGCKLLKVTGNQMTKGDKLRIKIKTNVRDKADLGVSQLKSKINWLLIFSYNSKVSLHFNCKTKANAKSNKIYIRNTQSRQRGWWGVVLAVKSKTCDDDTHFEELTSRWGLAGGYGCTRSSVDQCHKLVFTFISLLPFCYCLGTLAKWQTWTKKTRATVTATATATVVNQNQLPANANANGTGNWTR